MTSKERALLRGKAQLLNPIIMVGKEGASDGVKDALSKALEDHELVKVRFQGFKDSAKELSEELSSSTESELICVVGFTSVFYKKNNKKTGK